MSSIDTYKSETHCFTLSYRVGVLAVVNINSNRIYTSMLSTMTQILIQM